MIPYQKFTQCTSIGGYVPLKSAYFIALVALIPLLGVWLALAASLVVIPVLIALVLGAIAFCTWYLYHRLICLNPKEVCAIGVVTNVLRPNLSTVFSKAGDNDATINILLAPGPLNTNQDISAYTNHAQGNLIAEQAYIINAPLPYVSGPSASDFNHRKALHCEFEGNGIAVLLALCEAILAILLAILALTVFAGPWAAVVIAILEILAAVLALTGLWNDLDITQPTETAQGTDQQGNPGNITTGQIVLVSGDWIYDGGHTGWNEIHAVHNCQILLSPGLDLSDPNVVWPAELCGMPFVTDADVTAVVNSLCGMVSQAGGAVKGGSMTDPGNNWVVHPVVDGCQPVIV